MGLFTPVIREYLRPVSSGITGRLLDVGCGSKPYRRLFTRVTQYLGVDRIPERAGFSAELGSADVVGIAEDLPFADGSFDAVLATQVIDDLPDPERFLKEAARVLKTSGQLIMVFTFINPLHDEPFDFFRFTEYSVGRFCENAGLKVRETIKMGGGWLSVGYLSRHFILQKSENRKGAITRWFMSHLGHVVYRFFEWLDRRDPHPEAPLNYLVVAVKP